MNQHNTHPTVRFGDVAREVTESTHTPAEDGLEYYVGLDHLDPESLKIRRWGLIDGSDITFTRVFRTGQVLFGRRRAYQRKAALAAFDGICSGDIIVMEAKPDKLLPDLLPFLVQTEGFFQHALSTSAGSLSPRTKWSALAKYEFPLPPLDEQRRIAEILWAVEDTIEAYQICVEEIEALHTASYLEWFKRRNTQNWPNLTLNDICTIQSGQVDPTIDPFRNMIHIAPDDIESHTGRILELKSAVEDGVTSGKYEFEAGCILYSKIRPNLMKVAIPDFDGICSADMYPIYVRDSVSVKYLYHMLLSDDFTAYATASSVRSAIPKINRQALLSYEFRLPTVPEQNQLVDSLDRIMSANQLTQSQVVQLKSMKQKFLLELLEETAKDGNV